MADKKVDVSKLITDVKLKKVDWEPKVAVGQLILGGVISVDIALVAYQDSYFVSWPRKQGKEAGDDGKIPWFDMVKPVGDDGKIDKEIGNKISEIVTKAYEDLDDDAPF